ncbi:hypothetical protein Rsub_00283 [Raphidocelis subcapitata]|uniref:Uncharacterized protein n=1 Tax=Raphidocelis subcapitata TaxID=307507 RepID=A0A2V0NME4_9CHLO|nr:hypothetical protein Rsub_00283 [Raphidocelis subcapitata]|eukprot:GBF87572.1 hypothetical protein Rsub_00283 [Raphidocelis subcapitata]
MDPHKCSRAPGYMNPCPIVFPPEPYCFCIDSPTYIKCNVDKKTGNVLGLEWGGGSWMQDSWDVRNRKDDIYTGPDYRTDPTAVTDPGVNKVCRQPNGKKNDPVSQEDVVFPVDWPTAGAGPTDEESNRIIALFARVDVNTGDIAELVFLFNWVFQKDPNIPPDPTKDQYYSASCGSGKIYTDTKFFFHKSPLDVSFPGTKKSKGYESVLCGLRAQCQAPLLGKHGGVIKHTRHTSDMKLPILPCWSEQVKDQDRVQFGTVPLGSPAVVPAAAAAVPPRRRDPVPDAAAPADGGAGEAEEADAGGGGGAAAPEADVQPEAQGGPAAGTRIPRRPWGAPPQGGGLAAAEAPPEPGDGAQGPPEAGGGGGGDGVVRAAVLPDAPMELSEALGLVKEQEELAYSSPPSEVDCSETGARSFGPDAFVTARVALDRWGDMPAAGAGAADSMTRVRAERRARQHDGRDGGARRRRRSRRALLQDGEEGAVLESFDDGWEGLGAAAPGGGAAGAAKGASEAPPGAALDPALAVGGPLDGRTFALHAVSSAVVVYALDPASGTPQATHAPRALSSFFLAGGFGVGNQTDYQSPSAAFDKESRRFLLAAVSRGAGAGAPSVLWVGASAEGDPRQAWRLMALPAPGGGGVCGGGHVPVWEEPQLGYDSHGVHLGVTLACAPAPPAAAAAAGRAHRTERRAWLLSFDKGALYDRAGPAELTVAMWDAGAAAAQIGARAAAVTPAVPQSERDVSLAVGGAALAVAVDTAVGSDRLLFYAVTRTSRLAGLSPSSAPDAAPALCLVARGRNYSLPFAESEAAGGEMAQPGAGQEGALDAGRLDRAYSAALHAGRLYVATKAYGRACAPPSAARGAPGCRPAVHVSSWRPLRRGGAPDAAPAPLAPAAAGPGALLEDAGTALAFPALAVSLLGRPVVGYSYSSAEPGANEGSGFPGVAFSRLTPNGAVSGTRLRVTRHGASAIGAPGPGPAAAAAAAAAGRAWGGRSAADVAGGRVYLAVPYAPPGTAGAGAWIAVINEA